MKIAVITTPKTKPAKARVMWAYPSVLQGTDAVLKSSQYPHLKPYLVISLDKSSLKAMVERVAKAICNEISLGWLGASDAQKRIYLSCARAALSAVAKGLGGKAP